MSSSDEVVHPLALQATDVMPSLEFRHPDHPDHPGGPDGDSSGTGDDTLDPNRSEPAAFAARRDREPRVPGVPVPEDSAHAIRKNLLRQKLFSRRRATPVTFGRFKVLDVIGQGGMGIVYACYDDQLERKVAVKVLLGKTFQNVDIARARLLREAQAMARLSHPNIVTVLEVSTVDDQLYVAMEFVEGMSLDVWVASGPLTWREILAAYMQAGRGLEAAHRAGIIHRDFKPQNVMITSERVVKVLDFGLARASEAASHELMASVSDAASESRSDGLMRSLTRTGAYLGTPMYMSHEQHRGGKATAASDQFGYCVALYEALYGKHPFSITSLEALRCDIEAEAVAPVPPRSPVPARILKALGRGMSVEPGARFGSMSDLLAELARDPEAARRRFAITTAIAGLVGVASFTAASASAPGAEVCPDASAELRGVWDETRAAAVRAALLATGSRGAGETWAAAQSQLGAYAGAWTAMRDEACQTHAEARQSDPLFDLRTACLDQRRAGFAGLVDALSAIDATTIDRAIPAIGQLPALGPCADVEALTAAIPPPGDPVVRAQVQGQRESLARAQAQEAAGRYREGLATVTRVRERAVELHHLPLLAEALLRQGSLQMESGEPAAADASFGEALLSALTVDHKIVAAQAISRRIFVRAERLGRPVEALAELPLARALNAHIANDVDLRSEFLINVGAVYFKSAAVPEARRTWEAALALRDGGGREGTLLSLHILNNLVVVAQREHDTASQVALGRQLVARSARALGEHHPWHLTYTATLAQALARAGRPGEARSLLHRAEQALAGSESGQVRGWVMLAHGDLARGSIDHEDHDLVAARQSYQAVLDEPTAGAGSLYGARVGLGFVAAQEGREAEMRAIFESLLAESRQDVVRDTYAAALIDLGRAREASELLGAVLSRCVATDPSTPEADDCGWSRYQLGRAYQLLGDHAAAERVLAQQLRTWEPMLAPHDLTLLALRRTLGEAVLDQGRFDDAAEILRAVEAAYVAAVEADYVPLARTRVALARALTGERPTMPADAAALVAEALGVFRMRGATFAGEAQALEDLGAGRHTP